MYSVALRHFEEFVKNDISDDSIIYPEVIVSTSFVEGAKKKITVNAYERNPAARKKCIQHHGAYCSVCGFSFESNTNSSTGRMVFLFRIISISVRMTDKHMIPEKNSFQPLLSALEHF